MRRNWIWALPLSVAATIVWLSSRSTYPLDLSLPEPLDKVAHLAAFGTLAISLDIAWRHSRPNTALALRFMVLFTIVALFGASDELHQYFVPGRSCDFFDWIADAAGGALGLTIANLPMIWRHKTEA